MDYIWARRFLYVFLFWLMYSPQVAAVSEPELSVWTNQVIVEAYTLSADNVLNRQKDIAKYFTSAAWIEYGEMQALPVAGSVRCSSMPS